VGELEREIDIKAMELEVQLLQLGGVTDRMALGAGEMAEGQDGDGGGSIKHGVSLYDEGASLGVAFARDAG